MRIAVTGATGKQGGAVVDAALKLNLGTVVALTRNPDSEKSQALKDRGVEVVCADFDKPETLEPAFAGCDAAFLVTDFWQACGLDADKEIVQGKALADACKKAGVKHVVWSTLEDPRPIVGDVLPSVSGGRKVPHFEGKNEIDEYGKAAMPGAWTSLVTAIFHENLLPGQGMTPNRQSNDAPYVVFMPLAGGVKTAWCSVIDIGMTAALLIQQGPEKWAGKNFAVVSDHITTEEIAAVLAKVLNRKVIAVTPPSDDYCAALQSFGVPELVARDLTNMFTYYRDFGMLGNRPLEPCKELNPGVLTLEEWLSKDNVKEAMLSAMPE